MKTKVKINKNERSWAIEMITQINTFVGNKDLVIKSAGGECTVSSETHVKMFPDLILFKDESQLELVQGWELKMPDVPITDEKFISDARRKAIALNLSSFVIWNFTYAKLYVFNSDTNTFENERTWENITIKTREDVNLYQRDWKLTLKDVLCTVNEYLITNQVKTISIEKVISENALDILINENKRKVADHLRKASINDSRISAEISEWWHNIKQEYGFDEIDSFDAYAKNLILNWSYRILFAHLIKRYQNVAYKIDKLDYDITPKEANEIIMEISTKCDFYNIFATLPLNLCLPSDTWNSLIELSLFLKQNGINNIDQILLQNILENCVNTTRRELKGQFATPKILAEILVRITVRNWHEDCYDPCCGTGTIAKVILTNKKNKVGIQRAVESTWASDKYQVPLQIANISLASSDTIRLANRIFKKNALSLFPGQSVKIVDPVSGSPIEYAIPLMGAICSNLPFLSFENIKNDDRWYIDTNLSDYKLDGKSDISYYLAMHFSNILKDEGYLGIIVSNSWLGTKAGYCFYLELQKYFQLLQVHISGSGRWFLNADVVTTIMILKKTIKQSKTSFFVWRKSLLDLENKVELKEKLINSAILNRNLNPEIVSVSSYTRECIEGFHSLGLSLNSLFHNISWVMDIQHKLCPLSQFFKVFRGNRRGWDNLFFPKQYKDIEDTFLVPALINAKHIDSLISEPDGMAFCCSESLDTLRSSYPKAYNYIIKFKDEKNKTGRPLPEVLRRPKEAWYEMKANEIADIFTLMNPDNRIFFSRFISPSFINQRLIGFKVKSKDININLCHALMNCILSKFFIEAMGFGRGLGVLDISKDKVANCLMFNPNLLTEDAKSIILEYFNKICTKPVMTIEEELNDEDWKEYNKLILESYGIGNYYNAIVYSLNSLRHVRKTAKELPKNKHAKTLGSAYKSEFDDSEIDYRLAADL